MVKLELGYHDDKKGKWQSHEVSVLDNSNSDDYKLGVYSYNPTEITGYGATKEEALEDFLEKFSYIMGKLNEFETMLYDSNVIIDNMVNVDAFGHRIEE